MLIQVRAVVIVNC